MGDRLEAIDGQALQDLIDYRYAVAEPAITLQFWRDTDYLEARIEKHPDEELGLAFDEAVFDRVRQCANKCEFCFIHQMPKGFRESLYIEDDDYRLSFLQGNFITLTNLAERDWKRIGALRLSPLYISIHTTNPDLRREMVKQPLSDRMHAQLDRLVSMGIDFHAQIVLVPGRNDGAELDRTLSEIVDRWRPNAQTICIVPFGATRFRDERGLPELERSTPQWSRAVIDQVKQHQKRFKTTHGDPIVRLADEFYILADASFPGVAHYAGFPNLGDGVGGARLLAHEWTKIARRLPAGLPTRREATVVTGRAAKRVLAPVIERLNLVENLHVRLLPLASPYWGEAITVTGLITGADLEQGLKTHQVKGTVWIPDVMLRPASNAFLDDHTVEDVAASTGTDIQILTTDARGFYTAAFEPESLQALPADRWFGSYYK